VRDSGWLGGFLLVAFQIAGLCRVYGPSTWDFPFWIPDSGVCSRVLLFTLRAKAGKRRVGYSLACGAVNLE